MTKDKIFKVEWIRDVDGTPVYLNTFIESVSISGACTKKERDDDCVAVLSVVMYTGCFDKDKKVETLEEYIGASK